MSASSPPHSHRHHRHRHHCHHPLRPHAPPPPLPLLADLGFEMIERQLGGGGRTVEQTARVSSGDGVSGAGVGGVESDPVQATVVFIIAAFEGVGLSAAHAIPLVIVPDTIEWDELRSSNRQEAAYYSVITLIQKVSAGTFALTGGCWQRPAISRARPISLPPPSTCPVRCLHSSLWRAMCWWPSTPSRARNMPVFCAPWKRSAPCVTAYAPVKREPNRSPRPSGSAMVKSRRP